MNLSVHHAVYYLSLSFMPDSHADSIDATDLQDNSSQEQDQHHIIESNVPTAGGSEPPAILKITAYRLTVTAATIGFGLAKFLFTGEGKALQANVLDLVMGVPLALLYAKLFASCPFITFTFDYEGCSDWVSAKLQRHQNLRGSLRMTIATKSRKERVCNSIPYND